MTTASKFLSDVFGAGTTERVYICSLPNADARDREPGEQRLATREPALIEEFMQKWDRRDRGVYYCVATIKPTAKVRSKEALAELNELHVDVDFKSIAIGADEASQKLKQVRLPPSKIVHSGNGVHGHWIFKEGLPATLENKARVEAALRLLADHLAGDLACAEASRLMRLPGSHNSKNGSWVEVTVEDYPAHYRYELDELEEWLTETSPLIHRKASSGNGACANGVDVNCTINPWLAIASRFGVKPPIDVEQRLAGMRYQGAGDSAIHSTQLAVSASLLSRGTPTNEVIGLVLDATRAAAGVFGQRWNWRGEERAIRNMCESWIAKHPQQQEVEAERVEQESQTGEDNKREQPESKMARNSTHKSRADNEIIAAVVGGLIETVRRQGGDILLNGGALHLYDGGVWRVAETGDEQRLRVMIQQGVRALRQPARLGLVSAAWKLLNEHPDLYQPDVVWDSGGHIAVGNGVLDPVQRALDRWRPELYLRRKLQVAFNPAADAPIFNGFVNSLFSDRDETKRNRSLGLLQEFFGASLAIGKLNREQRRALLLVGPSRVGKSELARLVRLLVGDPVAAPAVAEIGERFGLSCFIDARAWIRDDAVNEGDRLNPERFKTVVTGEPIDIERKNRTALPSVRLNIPVLLTANGLPTARDSSDAIFNRCLVLEMTNVVDEKRAVDYRRRLGVPTGSTLAHWLFEREGAGILNWALEGLARLLQRGQFDIPDHVAQSIQRFKDEANPVAEWARTMLARSETTMIERADVLCAFQGWWREEMGDDVRLLGGRWLVPKLKAACPWMREIKKHGGVRYLAGIMLTDAGLKYWQRQSEDAERNNRGSKGSASSRDFVNQTGEPDDDETLF